MFLLPDRNRFLPGDPSILLPQFHNLLPIIGDGAVESCYPEEKGARILTVPEYNTVRSHTEKKIGRIGEDIFRGRTEIRPYLRKQFSSCNHCAYDRVCGYESALMGKEERLPVMKDAEAKERMYREGDGNGIHK